jgi:glycosyltransferase involved in cell wall biosynthesis
MPRVSVIMPAFNSQAFIAESIESVLGQTFTDLELIVVDDGSIDATRDVALGYAERDSRVRVFSVASNLGISHAINVGLKEARADLIGRLDADDISVPTRFERQIEFLDRNPDVVIVGSNAVHISETGKKLGLSVAGPPDKATFERLRREGGITMVLDGTGLMRRSVIDLVGGYDETFASAAEVDLHCRMADYGAVISISEPLTHYRLHTGSNVHTKFRQGRSVHRFVEYRQKELVAGRVPVGYSQFLDAEHGLPFHRRARIWLTDYSRAHYRIAGVHIAYRRWMPALSHMLRSLLTDPVFVIRRVWERRFSPRARQLLDVDGNA